MLNYLIVGVFFATFVALEAQQCYRCFGRHWCNDVSDPDFESNVTIVNCPSTTEAFRYEGDSPLIANVIASLKRMSSRSDENADELTETTWGCVTATIHEAHEIHTIRTCLNNAEIICPVVQNVILNPELNDVPTEVELDCEGCIGVLCNDHTFVTPNETTATTSSSTTSAPETTTSSTPESTSSPTTTSTSESTTSSTTTPSTTTTTTTLTPEASTTSPTTSTQSTSTDSTTTTPETPTPTSSTEAATATPTTTTEAPAPTSPTTTSVPTTAPSDPETTEEPAETTTTDSGQALMLSYVVLMSVLARYFV